MASPLPGPPSAVPRCPLKREPPATGRFFSPARRSSRSSMLERRTLFPHRPGVCLVGFPPPEPLLLTRLYPSVAAVRPLPVSALRATPFLNRPPPPDPLVSLELQDPSTLVHDHWSYPTTVEHHRPTPFAPPHRWPTVLVCPCPLLLAWHLLFDLLEISGNTLPPASRCRAAGERATAPSRVHVRCHGPSTVAMGRNSARALLNLFLFSILVK
jgi:hypothetical protein